MLTAGPPLSLTSTWFKQANIHAPVACAYPKATIQDDTCEDSERRNIERHCLQPILGRLAFDRATGLHNELFAEQLLQSDLGEKIDKQEGSRNITLTRLEELFRPVLNKESIDLSWPANRQLGAFINEEAANIAVTTHGRYSALVSRQTLFNKMLKSLADAREQHNDNHKG